MQTRLQKLELLRKSLITATTQLFPEVPYDKICITIHIHRSPELLLESKEAGFDEHINDNTHWFTSEDDRGDIVIFN